MARPIRIQYPGATYHMMARGTHGQEIFQDDQDRQRFLETLGEACEKTGFRIHAYVLMGNHYHLLVETPEGNLVAGMKWLQGAYTQRYNSRHKLFGHLFQGRYKAVPVEAEGSSYFEVVSTYIHLNPARGGLIRVGRERLKRYRWSSYAGYLSRRGQRPAWLVRERVLESLGLGPDEARGYEAYNRGAGAGVGDQGGGGRNWQRSGKRCGGVGMWAVRASWSSWKSTWSRRSRAGSGSGKRGRRPSMPPPFPPRSGMAGLGENSQY